MPLYKIGLDFGTHQTKICLEDSSDRRNKRYFFHRFKDSKGHEQYTIPSIVMLKKDRTLAYGYVDEKEALMARIEPLMKEPERPKLVLWSYPPKPKLPDLPEIGEPPQKPDYDEIASKYPIPIMPQVPEIPDQQVKTTPKQVFHDFSDLSDILKEEYALQAKHKSFGEAMIEYQAAKQRYFHEKKIYDRRLKNAIAVSERIYCEKLRNYQDKLNNYNAILARRDSEIENYEKRCREVDEHNELTRNLTNVRLAEYEKALQFWKEERMRPHPIVMRYFKQAVFSSGIVWRYEWSPIQVSIWYLTDIFFDLDEKYGIENLMVYMGTSSGKNTWQKNKEAATQILLTVYHLIEDIFHHDRQAFHKCTVDELVSLTAIVPYSHEAKRDNSIYVFPEAYANLNPMALGGRFGTGMNMVVDIGGGTTDISLFTAPHGKKVMIYDYISIEYGLNAISEVGVERYKSVVSHNLYNIVHHVEAHAQHIGVPDYEINRILQKRPIVYTGGGSTRNELCCGYAGFTDIKHLKRNVGDNILIEDKDNVVSLMAILSTALGLAMCKEKDDSEIKVQTVRELFKNVEEAYAEKQKGHNNDGYEHGLSDF